MKFKTLLITLSFSLTTLIGCQTPVQVYKDLTFARPQNMRNLLPNRKSIEFLIYDFLTSGAIVEDPKIKAEILNNEYRIFSKDNELEGCNGCSGAYIQTVLGQDIIYLRKDMFGKTYKDKNCTYFISPSPGLMPSLFHELFHDIWFNNLVTDEQKEKFAIQSKKVYEKIIAAKTKEQKLEFLMEIGFDNPTELDFEHYKAIINKRDKEYGEIFYGTELHARFAEKCIMRKIVMPKLLRPFYKGLFQEEWLNKSSPK